MSTVLRDRFNALGGRLDALKAGGHSPLSVLERARALFTSVPTDFALTELMTLDTALEHAGIHTSADAKLLKQLGIQKGRLAALTKGLGQRAEVALTEFERACAALELAVRRGEAQPSRSGQLEKAFIKLARIVKVAVLFSDVPEAEGPFELFARSRVERSAPSSARVAAIEFFAERASGQVADVSAKRKDLDLAHELLLRLSGASKADRARVRQARLAITSARDRLRAAPIVRSLDDLTRHLRHAARRDTRTAYRSLKALYERALEANDGEVASVAATAMGAMLNEAKNVPAAVERGHAKELFAWRDSAHDEELAGERLAPGGKAGVGDAVGDMLTKLAFNLDDDTVKAFELAAGASRLFDVEDALSEPFVEAELGVRRNLARRVSYPTQRMSYEFATGLDDVHNFVITQPGSVALNLAAGNQLVRQYLEDEPPMKKRRVRQTAVRVYVLDASGSMHGARARFRDAILIAELNAIRVKGKAGLPFDPLYFSFFNDTPTELIRVDSAGEASKHIESLFKESPALGSTNISLAVLAAFESIRNAQGRDPYLSRATVVLITDGEDGVDLAAIRKAKVPFEGVGISLSFISLGEENTDLKQLVNEQRSEGSRAFYHHLTDSEISMARTEFDSTWRTLLPPDIEVTGDTLERLLPHLEALDAIAQGRASASVTSIGSADQFDTFFPEGVSPNPKQLNEKLATRLLDVYEAIIDTASLASPEARAPEAVALLLHLLEVYSVSTPSYLESLQSIDARLTEARGRIRLLCRPYD